MTNIFKDHVEEVIISSKDVDEHKVSQVYVTICINRDGDPTMDVTKTYTPVR